MPRTLIPALIGFSLLISGCKTGEPAGNDSGAKDIVVESKDSDLESFQFKIRDSQVTYSKCERANADASPRCRIEKRKAWSTFKTSWDAAFLKGATRAITAGERRSQAAVERRLRSEAMTELNNDLDDMSERMRPWVAAIPEALGVEAQIGDETSPNAVCEITKNMACIEGNPEIGCQARSRDNSSLFATAEPSLGWCGARIRLLKKICSAGKAPADYSLYCYHRSNPPPANPDRNSIAECNIMWPRCFRPGTDATCDAKPRDNRNVTAIIEHTKSACIPALYAKESLCRHGVAPADFRINCVDDNPVDCRLDIRTLLCQPGFEPNTDGCTADKARGCRAIADAPTAEEAIARSFTKTPINGGINPSFAGLKIVASVMIGSNPCHANGREAHLKVDQVTAADGGPTTRIIIPVAKQVRTVPSNLRCPRNFEPVYKDATVEVRFNRLRDTVTLKHYRVFGDVETIVSPGN